MTSPTDQTAETDTPPASQMRNLAPPGHRLSPARRRWRRVLRWTEHVFAVIGLLTVLYFLCFRLSHMATDSMAPTLMSADLGEPDWILTEKLTYHLHGPRRWDVVEFVDGDGQNVMKRVIALPGETISMDGYTILINGQPIERPDWLDPIKYVPTGNLSKGTEVACGPGYFVLGDHTVDSWDSRYTGPISRQQIIGRAWLRVWPWPRFSTVNP